MKIPFFNYQYLFKSREEKFIEIIKDIGNRGAYILQKDLEEFEENLAQYIGVEYALGVANGTDAIWLALLAADIGKGDEVICTNLSFIAPANMIKLTGAKPVFVDVCKDSFAMKPDKILKKITKRTRAIMVIHPFGLPADIIEITYDHTETKVKLSSDIPEFGYTQTASGDPIPTSPPTPATPNWTPDLNVDNPRTSWLVTSS